MGRGNSQVHGYTRSFSLWHKAQHLDAHAPNLTTPFHGNEQPNASAEPRPRAGATQERRLLGVGSSALFGADSARGLRCMRVRPWFPRCPARRYSTCKACRRAGSRLRTPHHTSSTRAGTAHRATTARQPASHLPLWAWTSTPGLDTSQVWTPCTSLTQTDRRD